MSNNESKLKHDLVSHISGKLRQVAVDGVELLEMADFDVHDAIAMVAVALTDATCDCFARFTQIDEENFVYMMRATYRSRHLRYKKEQAEENRQRSKKK
jgi:hypothetical protein